MAEPHHPPSFVDEPAMTQRASSGGGANRTLQLDGAKGRKGRGRKRDEGRTPQVNRLGKANRPGATVTAKPSRVGAGEGQVLEWPWDRPATTVYDEDRLAAPGHHDKSFMSDANAVVISEKAAAILQGFPESAVFLGKTKKARFGMLGQAMPAPFAHAVATAVVDQMAKTEREIATQADLDDRVQALRGTQPSCSTSSSRSSASSAPETGSLFAPTTP